MKAYNAYIERVNNFIAGQKGGKGLPALTWTGKMLKIAWMFDKGKGDRDIIGLQFTVHKNDGGRNRDYQTGKFEDRDSNPAPCDKLSHALPLSNLNISRRC